MYTIDVVEYVRELVCEIKSVFSGEREYHLPILAQAVS